MHSNEKTNNSPMGFFRNRWLRWRECGTAAAVAATAGSSSASDSVQASPPGVANRLRGLGSIALIAFQLLLVLLVIRQFQLENRTFYHVMLLGSVGFVVHALLPLKYRLPFFSVLSLASIIVALGPVDGSYLIVLGLVLIGCCHLPLRLAVRVGLLLAVAALFAVWRMEFLPAPWSVAIWPLLASMFMFRLALYLYALQHDKKRPTAAQTLGYFFMLPNVCFPLYPVIDYSTFVRTYYDRDIGRIYQTGIRWIGRGLLHLILYRYVYLHWAGDPAQLATLGDLVRFLLATFLLYLRVSGQFHLCIGMLYLFGFRLPETHHLYYLAESFTDFWRRINIYWKDFMMKLVYYPSYFQLRRWGDTTALVGATIVVFLGTWLLHSYQWFWLRGGFPLEPQDALFWAVLGALVVFGSLREMKRSRKRRLGRGPVWSAALALRRFGTFTVICVLWSLWSADSIAAWLTMWTVAGNVTVNDLWLLAALIVGGLLVAGRAWSVRETDNNVSGPIYRQPALQSVTLLLGLLMIGSTPLYQRQSPQLAGTVASLQRSTLNARDQALQHRGYYEKLDNASRMSAELWNTQAPDGWAFNAAYRARGDFMLGELRPDAQVVFKDQPFTTNRWGMRDRDHSLAKPPGVYRIALLGPSHVMGAGVADGETFADFLEKRLNESVTQQTNIRYEVLNFGVTNYSLLQQLAILEERAVMFQPDAVFIANSRETQERLIRHLTQVIVSGIAIPYPDLNAMIDRLGVNAVANPGLPVPFEIVRTVLGAAGIHTRMLEMEAVSRLRPATDSFVRWSLERIKAVTRAHGAVPVFVSLDNVMDPSPSEKSGQREADAAGFKVFDLRDLWQRHDQSLLRVAAWDMHPNAAGHRLIANRLFELMDEHRSELGLDAVAARGGAPTTESSNLLSSSKTHR